MFTKEQIGWTVAMLASVVLGASLFYQSYILLGIGIAVFSLIYFLVPK